ncbi:glutamate--tRNA ligase [Candidatus Dependentiae bacterium]|nr:glutamate--tRNA ligase [Candidatus Dependentiae bacterium]
MVNVRTRFAPSPTGYLHVGGLRTALYAYLWAKKNNGKFLLRIEDTDRTRLVSGAVENIIKTLEWAGIDFDEGPGKPGVCASYIQSERLAIYHTYVEQLLNQGLAYECFCSAERLDRVRNDQIAQKLPPAYDKLCRNLTQDQLKNKKEENASWVVRMKVPEDGELTFNDVIRGDVTFSFKNVDDQVILKSDGYPTYHLAVVVDDHEMQISHVIRGEEWLSSTPKHILLYKAFGWQEPIWVHLPLMLNPDRSKLSKRQGDVAVEDYKNKGFFPEALVNFVAFLGWNPGDGETRELFSLQELIQAFSLERVGKSGAVFNIEKLHWFNQQYLLKKSNYELLALLRNEMTGKIDKTFTDEYLINVIELLKDRVSFVSEYLEHGREFFVAPESYDEAVKAKCWKNGAPELVALLSEKINRLDEFSATTVEFLLRSHALDHGLSIGSVMLPMRFALAGIGQGANLFAMIAILGKEETARRITRALEALK